MNAIDPNLLSNISKAIEDDTLVLPTLPEQQRLGIARAGSGQRP